MPSFSGATGWLNTEPLTPEGLRGRVVLVDFWTYTCVNWLRTLPYVRAWAAKYADARADRGRRPHAGVRLRARRRQHRRPGARAAASTYPIAIDSDYGVWSAFGEPLLAGGLHRRRARAASATTTSARASTRCSEMVIQQLLLEAGATDLDLDLVAVRAAWAWRSPPTSGTLRSPETYLGYDRASGLASPDGLWADTAHDYAPPTRPGTERVGANRCVGDLGRAAAASTTAGARLAFRFQARDVNLVMGPATRGAAIPFRVTLDGRPAGGAYGTDVAADGTGW